MSAPDRHLDAAALALGALPPDEVPAVEEHIEGCESCRTELAGFSETVARLVDLSAETPPASLRRTVLAAIAVTPQLPPALGPATAAVIDEPMVGRHRSDEPAPGLDTAADSAVDPAAPENVRTRRPWYRRPAGWIAAAAAVVVISGGVVAVNQLRGHQEVAQTPEQCVATAADRAVLTPATGQGSVTYAPSCAAVTVDVSGLPTLPADRTYQLWAISDQQTVAPRSLGLLPEAAAGQPQVVTETTNPGEVAMAITAEPAGGSTGPTLPIVWTTNLTS